MPRKIKILISTVWNVNDEDNELADMNLAEQSVATAIDYIDHALSGDDEMECLTVNWKEIKEVMNEA